MRRVLSGVLLAVAILCTVRAEAHFIWLDQKAQDDGKSRVLVYFGESAGPGEKELISKIAHTKAWLRDASGKAVEISLSNSADDETPALSGNCTDNAAASIEAFCDYGVYSRGGPGFLLQYYGKHLAGDWLKSADKLAKAEKLKLDIVPSLNDDKLTLTVLYQGKPAAEKEVVVFDPNEKQHDLTTNAEGQVSLPELIAGNYAIRAGHIEADKGGDRDGKKYSQTWHYCTLTFALPASAATKSASIETKAADPTAVAALTKARAGRAMWEDFPGISTDVTLTTNNQQVTGKAIIDESGSVMLEGFIDKTSADWLEEQLTSLVQHRMPDGEVSEGNITWADDDLAHPLGRKIDLGDPHLKSAYRLKDDVIMEVNRTAGPTMHFTISVLEIERNPEGKYLPRSFTMNFFDNKSGEVKTSLAYLNEWQRVGKFDLPKTIVEVNSEAGKSVTRRYELRNVQLAK